MKEKQHNESSPHSLYSTSSEDIWLLCVRKRLKCMLLFTDNPPHGQSSEISFGLVRITFSYITIKSIWMRMRFQSFGRGFLVLDF